jgi:valyl-tRNA synthetase
MLKSHLLTKKPAFKHVWIHGMGLDENGRKMSKSLGNVIDPKEALDGVGSDAFRFWACSETMPGDDFRISLDRMNGALKTLSKLWNVARFISMFPEKKRPKSLKKTDEWILAELNKLINACEDGYSDFNFYIPSNGVKNFVWNLFASQYIEMVKRRAYDGDESACFTLHTVLKTLLKILAPVTPHITCKLYSDMYGGKVHSEEFDKPIKVDEALADLTERLVEFNSYVWKTKKDKGLALNAEIKGIKKLEELKPFEDDLTAMHNLK